MGSLYFKFVYLRYDFDYHPGEVYWCTADIGWITGHSYITYGPMANGATSVMVSSLCITSQSLVMGNTTVIQTTVHGKSLEINILNELGKFFRNVNVMSAVVVQSQNSWNFVFCRSPIYVE